MNEIIIFDNQEVKLEVNIQDETVWLTQKQMSELFKITTKTISKHIINIYKFELDEKSNSQKMRIANSDKLVKFYNLDTIISVGYRVNSINGIIFRKWANKVLKDYMLKGYAINQKRLDYLEKTIKLIDIANRLDDELNNNEAREILKVIGEYSKTFNLLDNYDHKKLNKIVSNKNSSLKITYNNCLELINELKKNIESKLFTLEINRGLETIIGDIYQTYDNIDLYDNIYEKAANFLYLIVKNHVFY